jgi:hypothetical protein
VSWVAPYNGGEEITKYDIEIMTLDNDFVEDSSCSGFIENGKTCLFSHAYLRATYGFPVGHILQVRARAQNMYGYGGFSQINTGSAFIQDVPVAVKRPTEGAGTTYDQIEISWASLTTLTETGGTFAITSYELQVFSEGAPFWNSILGGSTPSLQTTYVYTNVVTGTDYQFRVRASNFLGWGAFSETVMIRADEVPAQIVPV